jgi:hypothetical protein
MVPEGFTWLYQRSQNVVGPEMLPQMLMHADASLADTCSKLFNGGIVAWIVRILPVAEGSALKVMLLALAMDDENQALNSRDAHLLRKAVIPGLVQKFRARPRRPNDHYYIGDILSKLAQHGAVLFF